MSSTVASLLRLAVASPRNQYQNDITCLDLAYITPRIIVCSMPTTDALTQWYRIDLSDLLLFLNKYHGNHWRIFNLQAEASGYRDSDAYCKVNHFGFPDHNPPQFSLLIAILQCIVEYLDENPKNVAVIHCKAGQGRSGTISCAYMIAEQKLSCSKAIEKFTNKRMRPGFGQGVSILSQRRYLKYTEKWAQNCRKYREITVKIEYLRIFNPRYRDIVVQMGQFRSNGSEIQNVYTFCEADIVSQNDECIIYRQSRLICLPSDVQLSFQHYKQPKKLGPNFALLHSTAYVWFNAFFETYYKSNCWDYSRRKGVFRAKWEDLDGFKGSHKRGSQAFDEMEVFWHVQDADSGCAGEE